MLSAFGSPWVAHDDVTLTAAQLPPAQTGIFLNSQEAGFVPFLGGGDGTLCLGGAIGRYSAQTGSTGAAGELELALDLTATPTPSGPTAVHAGETWRFQCWYRDVNPGPTSNLTDAVAILFR